MATFIAKLWKKLASKQRPLTVMIIGLDDSGKTSILNMLIAASSGSSPPAASTIKRTPDNNINNKKRSLCDSNLPPNNLNSFSLATDTSERLSSSVSPTIGYDYERIRYRDHTINMLDFSGQSKYRGLWQEFFNCVDGIVFVIDSSDLIRMVVVQDELENVLSHSFFATLTPKAPPKSSTSTETTDNTHSKLMSAQQLAQKQIVIERGKLIQSPLSDWLKASPQRGTPRDQLRAKIPILFMANKSDLPTSVDTQAVAEALKLDHVSKKRHPWHIQAASVRTKQGITEGFDWLINELLRSN